MDFKYEPKSRARSERALVIEDIWNYFKTRRIKLLKNKEISVVAFSVLLSPFSIEEIYILLSKVKEARNPGAMFWWFVSPKKPKK